ncbi:MAG: dihydrolipoyllysine acetyltransferase [Treponema sp. GWA1_62_8]|nr:MAG: dihydrolipoyllysine acetyltransferase [Treponema sp. GWA1_62_8]
MAHVLIMPRQGNTVESCVIVEWKAKEGDEVSADSGICEIETDKATFEVPAGEAGILLKILHAAGDDVPVLEAIAVIGAKGEDWKAALGASGAAAIAAPAPAASVPAAALATAAGAAPAIAAVSVAAAGHGSGAISPRARNLAAKEAVDASALAGSGPEGRVIERDVRAALEGRPALTAGARAALAVGGAVPSTGTGLGGRANMADIEAGVPVSPTAAGSVESAATTAAAAVSAPADFPGAYADVPVKGIRKLIADRMLDSLSTTAQFTLNASASAVRMQELRARFKGSGEELGLSKVTINDLLLFAVSRVLPKFPFMNAHKNGDSLRTFDRVHLGVAVDTPRGLMVPVIRNADLLTLERISSEAKRLAAACQGGSVKPEELSGSTFTVTNLGSLGIESFTPVINTPEVAILGVCGIEPKPVLDGDDPENSGVAFVPHIGFSLTINHQVVDGAPAARFLKAFREAVADIDLWLAK